MRTLRSYYAAPEPSDAADQVHIVDFEDEDHGVTVIGYPGGFNSCPDEAWTRRDLPMPMAHALAAEWHRTLCSLPPHRSGCSGNEWAADPECAGCREREFPPGPRCAHGRYDPDNYCTSPRNVSPCDIDARPNMSEEE